MNEQANKCPDVSGKTKGACAQFPARNLPPALAASLLSSAAQSRDPHRAVLAFAGPRFRQWWLSPEGVIPAAPKPHNCI